MPRHRAHELLLLAILVLLTTVPVAIAQDDLPLPPEVSSSEPIQPLIDQAQRSLERLMTASDAGDRKALASFRPYYDGLCGVVYIETAMEKPAAATTMVREIDKWLIERAQGGSATAQYWMAERASIALKCRDKQPDDAEIVKWYRAAAEQNFAPAQSALGQFLIMFRDFRRDPTEQEKLLLQAIRQGESEADKYLLWAIDVDSARPGYIPGADILAWLQQRSYGGDEKAKRLLARLAPKN